ncbi:ArnT family glycosyltransferase [Zeaxanthinibacter enoshimensis]|uniref:4-amino-4-deoxy-L-arabinose transferase-like glycosyltransferase n=1 Tax=Zeaxanthinibacter enoshimensis TaxID=392009 RepID=A0A4R6TTG2_9FLAO|nr:glycosyltransferase family 39 protein [Zeaxanthinibacter enoshimensis]TDQ33209.1 4-amino-4-deoxy-L-arabinose transferase-like glycosyltransferase [Zeaxanthinibacter enoshimensis]
MKSKSPTLLLWLLGLLLLVNMVQSHFTELLFDEAYYWYYAQDMAWGYFDHPPMVALMIKISDFFFDGELGVRFLSCILSSATLYLLWLMIDSVKKQQYVWHFFVLVTSMTLLNAYGFFTLPDTPLLFFTALFLWLYKKFLAKDTLFLALCLGVVMAALMYSKYHAVLVIGFVLLSNLRLLKNGKAWMAVVIALLCYSPHFFWLYENNFVSLEYHLYERPNRAYDFNDFTLGYFINLVALFGLTFPWIYRSLFKSKSTDLFNKALLYLVYGVLIFFFISSFQRRVQTQWIIVICIPMAVLVYNHILASPVDRKWIMRMGIANLVIMGFLRIGLVYPPLFPITFETHGNREWVEAIRSQIGDTPVVFENSYREAPMYEFYSGIPSFSLNNVQYRQNQYTIDGSEERVRGKKVLYIAKTYKQGDVVYQNAKGRTLYGKYIDDFQSFRNLSTAVEDAGKPGDGLALLKVYNPYPQSIPMRSLKFGITFLNHYKQVKQILPLQVRPVKEGETLLKGKDSTSFYFEMPESPIDDPGYFKITIAENNLYWAINGKNIKFETWNP